MGVRAALAVCALFSWAALVAAAPARAAGPPTLKIEIIGAGQVTGLGINCGLGALTCYTAYGTDPQAVSLTATAAGGWAFSHWEDDASACAAATSCPIAGGVTGAKTATAVFTAAAAVATSTYGVALTTEGTTAHGAVTTDSANYSIDCAQGAVTSTACSLTAVQGSTITVVENPDTGYFFAGWGGTCSGRAVSCATYLASDQAFVSADFLANSSNTLSVSVSGNGSVSGGGISCGAGSTCSAPEPPNANVTLTASAADGWVMTGWTGGCTGLQSTCTVQMNAARSVTATFAQLVTFSVAVTGDGFVTGPNGIGCDGGQTCTGGQPPNQTITLTAHPNGGGNVLWSGCTSTAGNLCSVSLGTTATSVTATFSGGVPPPIATNSLSVIVKGGGYVTATTTGGSIYCTAAGGSGCTVNVQANTTLTLTAIPASGTVADFTHWLGDCSVFSSTSCTLTMTSSKSVEADFAGGNTTYVLSASVTGSGTVTGAGLNCTGSGAGCSVSQAAGASVALTASAGFDATFTGWGGACSGTGSCLVSMTQAKSVTATFTTSAGAGGTGNEVLTISVTGAGGVTATGGLCSSTAGKRVTCSQRYEKDQKVALAAKPASGYVLTGWKGACTGKKSTCDVTMSAPETVSAVFGQLVLAPTEGAEVTKTSSGYRATLFFSTRDAGTATVTVRLGSKTVGTHTAKVEPGSRRIAFTVAKKGRYLFTLTLGKHAIRWGVTVG